MSTQNIVTTRDARQHFSPTGAFLTSQGVVRASWLNRPLVTSDEHRIQGILVNFQRTEVSNFEDRFFWLWSEQPNFNPVSDSVSPPWQVNKENTVDLLAFTHDEPEIFFELGFTRNKEMPLDDQALGSRCRLKVGFCFHPKTDTHGPAVSAQLLAVDLIWMAERVDK
jgi:hypothetical protein